MHGGGAGEKGGDDESRGKTEEDGKHDAKHRGLGLSVYEPFTKRIAEEEVADEGAEGGGEEGDMNPLAEGLLLNEAEEHDTKKRRPHVENIETVKAVGNDENVARKGGRLDRGTAEKHDQVTGKSAEGGVEEGASKPAQGKVVGDKLCGGGEDAHKIRPEVGLSRHEDGEGDGEKESKTQKTHIKGDDASRPFCVMYLCFVGRKMRLLRFYHDFMSFWS